MNDLTILINSCDLYESAWEPFFRLFMIQWPDCPYDFVLNTETKQYQGSLNNVKTINTPNSKTWTMRFRNVLNQIDSEYILFMLEDYFVLDKINDNMIYKALDLMKKNNNIGMAALIANGNQELVDSKTLDDPDFFSRKKEERCKIWCVPAIWKKDYLLSILRDHENIWQFEDFAAYRIIKTPEIIIQQRKHIPHVISYKIRISDGIGITLKKWLPKNKELFEKYDIPVNYDELGWFDMNPDNKKPENNSQRKNVFREALYSVKHFIKELIKKLKKKKQIYLSKK